MTAPMRGVLERAFEVASVTFPRAPRDRLAHPFGFGEHEPYRWRMSPDVWAKLREAVGSDVPRDPPEDVRLLGEAIGVDEALPPNSLLLEPDK